MSGLFSPEYLIPLNMSKLSNHLNMRNIVMVSLAEASLSEENPANSLPVNDVIIIPNALITFYFSLRKSKLFFNFFLFFFTGSLPCVI